MQVKALATPLLASLIEEGFHNNSVSKQVIESYLEQDAIQGISQLILACTHYPLIQKEIEEYYKGNVQIVNSAEVTAQYIFTELESLGLLNERAEISTQFFVSDYTESFDKSADHFFGEHISLEEVNIWE